MKKRRKRLIGTLLVSLMAGCTVGPKYVLLHKALGGGWQQ
jgi:hypothetical protein